MSRRTVVIVLLVLVSRFGEQAAAQQMVFPGEEWVVAVPEDVWIDSVGLEAAVESLRENSPAEGKASMNW